MRDKKTPVRLLSGMSERRQRKIIAIPLMILLIPLIWFSATRAISGGTDYFLERQLKQWSTGGHKPTVESWNKARDLLELSESLTPGDPRLLRHAAQLYEWRAWLEKDNPKARQEYRQTALMYHRRGLKVRPAWPYAWADFTTSKMQSGEFDEEFQKAFQNSAELGPWEVGVQLDLTRIGLQNWRKLNDENRHRLRTIMANALRVQEHQFFAMINKLESLPMVCFTMEKNPTAFEYCKKKNLY